MAGDADADADDDLSPGEAFALVGHETRFRILRALFEAEGAERAPDGSVLSFSELREAVEVADSGQFNYHLSKLVGPFVRKAGDGYRLTVAGDRVIGAVLSGAYTRRETTEPVPVDDPCPHCGGELRARYVEDCAVVECVDEGERKMQLPMPPGALEGYEPSALPAAFDRWVRAFLGQLSAGVCPICTGRLDPELVVVDADGGRHVDGRYGCRRCDSEFRGMLAVLIEHPAVVAFHHDHGIDPRERLLWALEWLFDPRASDVEEDPLRARIEIRLDDEVLTATVDATLDVVDYRREPVA